MKGGRYEIKKILIFCILIFFIIFISEASAEIKNVLENDGTDWWKIGYVGGFITGAMVAKWEFSICVYRLESEVDKEICNEGLNRIDITGITVGQIRDGVNAFYNDFSNRRIKIVDAIYIVKMRIKGEDPELIDSQIRYLKMQPIDKEIINKSSKKYVAFRKKRGRNPTYKEIKNGDFSFENLLRSGIFIDASNNFHLLVSYGTYK